MSSTSPRYLLSSIVNPSSVILNSDGNPRPRALPGLNVNPALRRYVRRGSEEQAEQRWEGDGTKWWHHQEHRRGEQGAKWRERTVWTPCIVLILPVSGPVLLLPCRPISCYYPSRTVTSNLKYRKYQLQAIKCNSIILENEFNLSEIQRVEYSTSIYFLFIVLLSVNISCFVSPVKWNSCINICFWYSWLTCQYQ